MFIPFLAKKMFHAQNAFSVTLITALRSNKESGTVEHAAYYYYYTICMSPVTGISSWYFS